MTTFITVGVERIQAFLSRSRHLWGRRGASETLVRLTALAGASSPLTPTQRAELAVERVLQDPRWVGTVGLNPEGLDLDGVVSLIAEDPDPARAEKVGRAAGEALVLAIRAELPGTTVALSWITSPEGESFAEQLTPEKEMQWSRIRYFPAPFEFPLIRPCDECHVSPASIVDQARFFDDPVEELRLCADCHTRLEHEERRQKTVGAGWRPLMPSRFVSEWQLLDRLRREEWPDMVATRDLAYLASLVRVEEPKSGGVRSASRRGNRGNHVARVLHEMRTDSCSGKGLQAVFRVWWV